MGWDTIGTFANNAISSVADRVDLRNSPFETVIGAIGFTAAFTVSPLLGIILMVAEAFGIGPGMIGAFIDKASGFKSGGVKPVLDMNSFSLIAGKIMDMISEKVGSLTSGASISISETEIRKMANLGIIASYDKKFIKLASTRNNLGNLWKGIISQRKGTYTKFSLTKILTGFLWTIAKGLLAMGIIGGISKTVSGKKEVVTDPTGFLPGIPLIGDKRETKIVQDSVPDNWFYYKNIKNNIQDTLIYYLNNNIASFSNAFYKENNIQIYNSPQMRNLLGLILEHNYAPISHLDSMEGFVAPNIKDVAERIMPGYKYSKIEQYKPKTKPEE